MTDFNSRAASDRHRSGLTAGIPFPAPRHGSNSGVGSGRVAFDDKQRTAGHEAGHVIVRRMLGTPVEGCTIDPDIAGPGRKGCVWSPPDSREAPSAEDYAAQRIVELAGGMEAERLFWPEREPKFARSDTRKAIDFASQVCDGSHKSIAALLALARIEAARILAAHRAALEAIAAALIEHGTLDGAEIDQIILESELSPALRAERARRKQMAAMTAGAAAFCAAHGGLMRLNF